MQAPTSLAKLTAPVPARAYQRLRLFERLDDALRGRVVWIPALAGSGKTTLIADYLLQRGLAPVWYHLDGGDRDPAAFFEYLGLAAAQVTPDAAAQLPSFAAEPWGDLEAFARHFFRRLFALIAPRRVLVLDDYHELPPESPVHGIMRQALAEVPAGFTVIVLSRMDPPPELTRLRMLDTFTVFDRDELLLSAEETAGFVRQRLGASPVSIDSVIDQGYAATRGWIAGIVLVLEQGGQLCADGRPPALEASTPLVFDYLAGEIFTRTAEREQQLLLKTALLPSMSAAAAEALTGQSDAGAILDGLYRRNYFTLRHLREGVAVYEYHPLFREFLLSRAERTLPAVELTALKRRAAQLLIREGQIEAAVKLLRDTADWWTLTLLVVQQAPQLVRVGRYRTLGEWLSALPQAVLDASPWLTFFMGVAKLPFDIPEARRCFIESYRRFKQQGAFEGAYLAWARIIDSYMYAWREFRELDQWIAELDDLRQRCPTYPRPDIELQVTAGLFAVMLSRRPGYPGLPALAAQLGELLQHDADPVQRIAAGSQLVFYYGWWAGNFAKAAELIGLLQPITDRCEDVLSRLLWDVTRAGHHWMCAEFQLCREAAEHGLTLAEQHGVHHWDMQLLGQLGWAALTSGDQAEAGLVLRRMRERLNANRRFEYAQYLLQSALEARLRQDLPSSHRFAEDTVAAVEEVGMPYAQCFASALLGKLCLRQGDHTRATALYERVRGQLKSIGSAPQTWGIHLELAEFDLRHGQRERGLQALSAGLAIAAEYGLVNAANWSDEAMAFLLAKALEHGIEPDYARLLIRRRGLLPPEDSRIESWPWPVQIYTLGRFEILLDGEVLRFSGKTQKKPLELLKLLIANGGRQVPEAKLSEALWPDAEGDAAHRAFITTLQRLRKLLGSSEVLQYREGQLTLDERYCWTDVWALEELDGADAAAQLRLYLGPFLTQEPDAYWATSLRERLRRGFVRAICRAGAQLEAQREWRAAIELYEQGLKAEDCAEEFYQQLMHCHAQLGQRSEAVATYHRCRQVLAANLEVKPSAKTEALHRQLAEA